MEGKKEVDELASEIICRGARAHKRLLVRALSTPPVKRPEVVPRYARLAAILTACFKHIGSELTSIILDEFEQSREACANGGRDGPLPSDLSYSIHLSLYLGELTKFTLLSSEKIFGVLKQLVDTFSHAHVQMACSLLTAAESTSTRTGRVGSGWMACHGLRR